MQQMTDARKKELTMYALLNVDTMRQQYADQIGSVSFIGAVNNDGMPHGTTVGQPTENKAFQLTSADKTRLWIVAVEKTEQAISAGRREYLLLRREARFMRVKAWTKYIAGKYAEWQSKRPGSKPAPPTQQAMNIWMHEILFVAIVIAEDMGLFRE